MFRANICNLAFREIAKYAPPPMHGVMRVYISPLKKQVNINKIPRAPTYVESAFGMPPPPTGSSILHFISTPTMEHFTRTMKNGARRQVAWFSY